jgi:hypothetical protein
VIIDPGRRTNVRPRPVAALALMLVALAAASCQRAAGIPVAELTASPEMSVASPPRAVAAPAPGDTAPALVPPPTAAVEPSRAVVYYFHRTIRCVTCLKFEELTERALRGGFADELASGRLAWRVMDFEESENEPLATKYDVFESSVVVSKLAGEREVEWKKLEDIWGLVEYEGAFIQYVQSEVAAYLDAVPAVSGGDAAEGGR